MTFAVKTCASPAELRAAFVPMAGYLGFHPDDAFFERTSRVLPTERVIYAQDGDCVAGGMAAFPFQLSIPGALVPATGLSFVGVLPTHRRRGILSGMMRALFDACRARGEPLAYLWASEDTIYGRYGYGLAGQMAEASIDRAHAKFRGHDIDAGTVRMVALDQAEPLVAPVYEHVTRETPGMFLRTSDWWQTHQLSDQESMRRGGVLHCAVIENAAGPQAYALYRLNPNFERGISTGTITINEAMGVTPEATRAIWRFLFDIDWLPRVKAWMLPLDHPLHLLLAEPRRLNFTVRDGVWVRLVDAEEALSARSYADAAPIVVELADDLCPWNAGRWLIGSGRARRTDQPADLHCDTSALASAFLGGFSWRRLAAAFQVRELRPGGLERADLLFRTTRAPWCTEIF